jgi:hypothetical protein
VRPGRRQFDVVATNPGHAVGRERHYVVTVRTPLPRSAIVSVSFSDQRNCGHATWGDASLPAMVLLPWHLCWSPEFDREGKTRRSRRSSSEQSRLDEDTPSGALSLDR